MSKKKKCKHIYQQISACTNPRCVFCGKETKNKWLERLIKESKPCTLNVVKHSKKELKDLNQALKMMALTTNKCGN